MVVHVMLGGGLPVALHIKRAGLPSVTFSTRGITTTTGFSETCQTVPELTYDVVLTKAVSRFHSTKTTERNLI